MALLSSKKIKVMFVIDFIYGSTGGTENQVLKLIDKLDSNKYELYLLSFGNTQWLTENRSNLKCNVNIFEYNIFNHKDFQNIIVFWQIMKYIKKVRPDIVMTFFKISYILGVLAAHLAGTGNIISTRRDFGLWLDKRSLPLLRFANRFIKGIITNSQNVKELTRRKEKFDISKIQVIYNGIDPEEYLHNSVDRRELKEKLGIPVNNKVVGIVAGLRPMKRHRTFLNAAKRILQDNGDIHFVIVGDGPLKQELETLVIKLDIKEHIHFVGWQKDIPLFLSIFNIGVNCSANEGLSNAIMEYMAYGVPCIVSDAGGNPELIENGVNGYIFELDNDKELAELVINLLQDKKKQEEFVFKSKEIIKNKFGLERMINEYDNHLTQILNSNN